MALVAATGRIMYRTDQLRHRAFAACTMQVIHHTFAVCGWLSGKHVGTACCTIILLADFGRPATAVGRRKVVRICCAAGGLGGGSQQHGQGAPRRAGPRAAKTRIRVFRRAAKRYKQ